MKTKRLSLGIALSLSALLLAGCGAQPATNTTVNVNANTTNTVTNSNVTGNSNTVGANSVLSSVNEPNEYQATVALKFEAVGDQKVATMPTLSATVARSGDSRRMEFAMPAGGRVVFLDKSGANYLILPDKNQYAELDKEALGFEVRRMLMPEQIVERVKAMPGVRLVGEEQYNGRTVQKYEYGAVANTQTQAGQVATQSYLLVDKETGLPLRSETLSRSQSGGNVQGFSGVRVITEISDVKTEAADTLFEQPGSGLQKIETSQVRAQVDMIFNTIASFVAQMMQQSQQQGSAPAASPAR